MLQLCSADVEKTRSDSSSFSTSKEFILDEKKISWLEEQGKANYYNSIQRQLDSTNSVEGTIVLNRTKSRLVYSFSSGGVSNALYNFLKSNISPIRNKIVDSLYIQEYHQEGEIFSATCNVVLYYKREYKLYEFLYEYGNWRLMDDNKGNNKYINFNSNIVPSLACRTGEYLPIEMMLITKVSSAVMMGKVFSVVCKSHFK